MTGRFIHSLEIGVDASGVPVRSCIVSIACGVDDAGEVSVATASVLFVGVYNELLYLGVGIVCSSVSVGVVVTVGMDLDSAWQAVVNMKTSKVRIRMRFIVMDDKYSLWILAGFLSNCPLMCKF
jgi:hypothetical protein